MESQTTRVLELYILSRIRVPHKWVSLLLTQTYYLDLQNVGFTVAYSNLLPRFAFCNLCFSNFHLVFKNIKKIAHPVLATDFLL
jgi:hypothetical protein